MKRTTLFLGLLFTIIVDLHGEQKTWIRFAENGNPNGDEFQKRAPYTKAKDNYLEFGDSVQAKNGLRKKECNLFIKINKKKSR